MPMAGYRDYAYLPEPDVGIGGGVGQLENISGGFVTVYVEVDDPEATLERAVQAGAQVTLPATHMDGSAPSPASETHKETKSGWCDPTPSTERTTRHRYRPCGSARKGSDAFVTGGHWGDGVSVKPGLVSR